MHCSHIASFRIHDPTMRDSCIMPFFVCHEQNGGKTQPTTHRKVDIFHWIIQIGFDSFPLEQKSDKI